MLFDDTLEEHRMAGVSLRCGMHQRVRLVTCAFANERSCALGRWIHEEGARCDEVPELQQLRMAHASFHTIALVIAISITQGVSLKPPSCSSLMPCSKARHACSHTRCRVSKTARAWVRVRHPRPHRTG